MLLLATRAWTEPGRTIWRQPGWRRSSMVLTCTTPSTSSATRLLGVDNVPGTRKIGQFACLIATPHNPRTDIQTVNRVSFVTKNGEVVER